jgi:hypothetical protein
LGVKNTRSSKSRERKMVRRSKSGVKAAAVQDGKRPGAAAGNSFASWTAAASEARRRFAPRRSLADYLDAFAGLVKQNDELVPPSHFSNQ